MRDAVLIEVSDILDSFDINELTLLLREQIMQSPENGFYIGNIVDHFRPLYFNYAKLQKLNLDEDVRKEADTKFRNACRAILDIICEKFHIDISDEWLDDNESNIEAITLAFYTFFVLDFSNTIFDVMTNYILQNSATIEEAFSGMKSKKDASTLANKKTLSPKMSLIVSNVYDIGEWVFSQLDAESFFSYMEQSYLPMTLVRGLYHEGKASGDFAEVINEIFSKNISLKSATCFNFMVKVRTGEIRDIFAESAT